MSELQAISTQAQKRHRRKHHKYCAKAKRAGVHSDLIASPITSLITFVAWNKRVVNLVWSEDFSTPDLYQELGLDPRATYFECNGRTYGDAGQLLQNLLPGSIVYCLHRLHGGMKRKSQGRNGEPSSSHEGARMPDHFPAVRQQKTARGPEAEQASGHAQDGQSTPRSTKCDGRLWISNLENKELACVQFPPADLVAVDNIEGLCRLLHNLSLEFTKCNASNRRSIKTLQLVNDLNEAVPFVFVDTESSKQIMRQGKELWCCEENTSSTPVTIKVQPSSYRKFSSKCLEVFNNPLYFQDEGHGDGTIYDKLNLPALTAPRNRMVLKSGIDFSERDSLLNSRSSSSRDESDTQAVTGGDKSSWISRTFPDSILLRDLQMTSRDEDRPEKKTTLAIERLKVFIQDGERCKCVLKSSPENLGNAVLQSGLPCYQSVCFRCNGCDKSGNACSHYVRYRYSSLDPEHGVDACDHPIFRISTSQGYNQGHSCNQDDARARFDRATKGKIPPEQLQRAIWCLDCAIPLRHIVASCGHDPMNYQEFDKTMRRFRDAIRYKLRADKQCDIDVLLQYLDKRVEEGHTAFACVEGVSGSVDKMRIFLQSAEQILFLKEQRITAISLDFVYKLIPNVGLCFGHFTTMSPSGKLIPLATFLVEGESGDAVDWVFQRYEEALEKFGIEGQSSVSNHNHSKTFQEIF